MTETAASPAANAANPPNRPVLAAVWVSGAVVSFTAMGVAGREAGITMPTFEIMLYRSMVGFAILCAFGFATGQIRVVRLRHPRLHLIRNLCHFTGQNLWFFALTAIPLAQVFALEFTTPVWIALLAPLVLGEMLTMRRLAAVVLGLCGILLITQPGFAVIGAGQIAAAAAALFFAGSVIATKRLSLSESTFAILFWMTLMQLVMGFVTALHDGAVMLPTAETAGWLVLIGICGLSAHLCITSALAVAPATTVGPMDMARLPVIALVGWLVYEETLTDPFLAGAALILLGNLVNLGLGKRGRAR